MTQPCPDWRALSAHRNDPNASEPAGWQEALAHLDGCPACRREAPAADPTLLFRRLPGLDMSPHGSGSEAAEVESMIQAVATLRTARLLSPPRERAAWKRWSAAAALATVALSLGAGHGLPRESPAMTAALDSLPISSHPGLATAPAREVVPRFASEQVPVVEELNRPAARVYQMDGGKNLSVVMIVDERLDV